MKSEPDNKMNAKNDEMVLSGDILVVDDEVPNLKLMTQLLAPEGYRVRPAKRPQLAIDSALAKPPALILLDVRMPEMDGFEVCRRLKQDERTRDIPIIFVSALRDVKDKVRGLEAGGVDFISKPYQEREVLARVRTHIELRSMQLNLEEMVASRTAQVIEQQERFRATFEQAAIGMAHVSPEGKFLRINQKFCDIVGYSREEMLKLSFQEITHADDLESDLKYVQQVLSREIENYSLEKRYYRKDGSIVWITLTVSLMFDDKGAPDYFIGAVQDISERKQLEETKSLLLHDYGERLKEIQCLHAISNSTRTKSSLDEVFQDAVSAIPPGWHYPEFTRGKLRYGEETWVSEPFEESEWNQSADIIVNGKIRGRVEVYYLEESPTLDEGPFMKEERTLLDDIARTLSESIEHRKSNQNLLQSEMKYRDLVDNSLIGVFTTTTEGGFLFVNEAIVRMYDFDNAEHMLTEGALSRWVEVERREQMLAELRSVGSVSNFQVETYTHTGRRIHVIFSATMNSGVISGMVMDITEMRKAKEKLSKSEEKFRTLIENIPDVTWTTDSEGKTTFMSSNIESIYGYTRNEIYGQGETLWFKRIHPDDVENVKRAFESLFDNNGSQYDIEYRIQRKDGVWIWLHDRSIATYEKGGMTFANGIFSDITERRRTEERLRVATSELIFAEEKERQSIASELHDGAAQSLALARLQLAEATGAVTGSAAETALDKASQQVRQSLEQIRSVLLDLSSPTLHQMGLSTGLSEWLDDNIRDKYGLRTVFHDECGEVLLPDEMRFLLFRNVRELLTNVVKHGQAHSVSVNMARVGQTLQIVVEDDGVGFAPASLNNLPDNSGGFGLFSIRERMTDLGGSLQLVTAPGKGCKATLFAPLESVEEGDSQ